MASQLEDWSKRGLFKLVLPGIGECARTHLSAGDAAPFLDRAAYEALDFQPPFDQLPTRDEYRSRQSRLRQRRRSFERIWLGEDRA